MRIFFFLALCFSQTALAQVPAFRYLTTADGLNDGTAQCFGQDKYGYIWIGTPSGLNRYNGHAVKRFVNQPGDSSSVYPGHIWGIGMGPDQNMYFGTGEGLARYNYHTGDFTRIVIPGRNFAAGRMVSSGKDSVLHATSLGLLIHNTTTGKLSFFSDGIRDSTQLALARRGLGDIERFNTNRVFATSAIGLMDINLETNQIRLLTVPGLSSQFFDHVEVAKDGTVWLSLLNLSKLVKTDTAFNSFKVYDYLFPDRNVLPNAITSILLDGEDHLWVTTGPDGLCYFREETNSFVSYKTNRSIANSLLSNNLLSLFQDREGIIWVGTNGYGVNYFQPHKKLFEVLLPLEPGDQHFTWLWSRAASEDDDGNLWLATSSGVIEYNRDKGVIQHIRNTSNAPDRIYYNSVRGIFCEGQFVWMITGGGINRYHRSTGRMEFLSGQQGLPRGFYFTAYKDSRGILWIGGRDHDGLFYREKAGNFKGVAQHPVLKKLLDHYGYGVRSIFEDSKKRMWFGLNSGGLAMYEPAKEELKHWQYRDGDTSSLTGNLVTGIAEDRKGVIWISTTSGIASFNEYSNQFTQYTQNNGLPSVRTSSIQVDGQNRVWAGSTHGLLMLDASRTNWILFDHDDGLPDAEFADMPSQQLRDGRFIFPTLKGFVVFDPLTYREEVKQIPVYISGLTVFNKEAVLETNYEALKQIHFRYDQNFFSIELTAVNFENPTKTWYAYKLDGFNKDWIYTKERIIHFTNVPGGNYRLVYKASANPDNWNVPEHVLHISVGTVYYKTVWFWAVIVILFLAAIYLVYRFRMNKQKQILQLETKARELEKEKTVVQYESLKQHLNPHFLFNSLSSLRSLIKTDTKTATGFLDGLSKVYRYVLKSGEKELSLLGEEIDFVKTFVLLQRTRFREGLEVRIDVQEESLNAYIVPVTLQNLLENAIKHNTADEESPLRIQVFTEKDYVVVKNNLQRYASVETSNKQGLDSLKKLYQFYTEKPIIITDDGTVFEVKIPLL